MYHRRYDTTLLQALLHLYRLCGIAGRRLVSVLGSLLVENGVFTGRCKVSPNSIVSPDYGRILLNLVAREDSRRQALRVGQRVSYTRTAPTPTNKNASTHAACRCARNINVGKYHSITSRTNVRVVVQRRRRQLVGRYRSRDTPCTSLVSVTTRARGVLPIAVDSRCWRWQSSRGSRLRRACRSQTSAQTAPRSGHESSHVTQKQSSSIRRVR